MSFTLRPVSGKEFINREELLKELVDSLKNPKMRDGFALYGVRRVGKTSVLLELQGRLAKEKNVVPVYFSLWDLVEYKVEEFTKKLTLTILEAYRPKLSLTYTAKELAMLPVNLLRKSIGNLKLGIRLKEDIEFLLSMERKKDADLNMLIEDAFMLPEKIAKETNTRCILIIDEFPTLMDLKNGSKIGEGVIRKIRTVYEKQKHVILCISGSIKSTMDTVVISSGSAFYKQLVVRKVRPLDKNYVFELLKNNLEKIMDEDALEEVYTLTNGIPFYVHFIGRYLERATGKKIKKADVNLAVDDLLSEEGNILFTEEFEDLSAKERLVIIAIATGKTYSPTAIADLTNERTATVGVYLSYLNNKGLIDSEYHLTDPVFELWLEKKFGD